MNIKNLKPFYNIETNKDVFLSEEDVEIDIQGQKFKNRAKIYCRLLPTPRIVFNFELTSSDGQLALMSTFFSNNVSILIKQKSIHGHVISYTGNVSLISIVWVPDHEPVILITTENDRICSIIFHLFNFKDFVGKSDFAENQDPISKKIAFIRLCWQKWEIELRSLFTTDEVFKTLKSKGGFGLTHLGLVRRNDNSNFTSDEAEKLLIGLRFFLSFAKGCWSNPSLAVYLDDCDKKIAEFLSSPSETWNSPTSWFDPYHVEQLSNLFPLFMEKWNNEYWGSTLKEVIYWYLNANNTMRGIDAGIILTQSAIERLSYEYVVNNNKLLSKNGFKDLRASDKFRRLFSSINIPVELPSSLENMKRLSKQHNWIDAPHALTEIRNSLVHPEHKRKGQFRDALFEAWNLGLWYLELSILRICDYTETYSNRLTNRVVGQVEKVPWENS